MTAPAVSIIVPVYNVAEYLPRCIESVLRQDEAGWELILVNDGSTDGSGALCDAYAGRDSRIVSLHQPNKGVSSARNAALDAARGKYICFIDSDDWVEERYLSSMLLLAGGEDKVVYADVTLDYEGKRRSGTAFHYLQGSESTQADWNTFMVRYRIPENGFPVAKLFSRKIVETYRLRFNADLSYHEDHLFVLNYLLHVEQIALSAEPCYHYMHRGTNTSLSKKRHPAKNMILAAKELEVAVRALISRFGLKDQAYISRLYTLLGLNQLVRAALCANAEEIRRVGDAVRACETLFRLYYSPNHRYLRFIPFLFFIGSDRVVLWISKLAGKYI